KVRFPAPGIMGGAAGMAGAFSVDGEAVPIAPRHLEPGETYFLKLPGGGGYGDPRARSRERVAEDVRNGYVSPEVARRDYGLEGGTA
ncbi:MAG: hydantoinase B/oxoprolinase family protein, partial [Alphaproteobacteria bacterium]|nr:hydantoinase B/oxoprolinase family protein [Alphaproteobacteria bacterium]